MLKRKIIQVGDSYGITIPLALMEDKGLKKGDIVSVTLRKVSKK